MYVCCFVYIGGRFFLWSPHRFLFPKFRYLFGLGFEYFRVWFFCGVVLVGKCIFFSLYRPSREEEEEKEEEEEEEEEGDFFFDVT